jgi:hypothetical protein
VHSFSEADKLTYAGDADDGMSAPSRPACTPRVDPDPPVETIFYFNCFNVEDPDDRTVGLLNGQLAIPGHLLREAV